MVASLFALLATDVRPPDGFRAPGTEIFETPCLIGEGTYCANRVMLYMVLSAIIIIALFVIAFRKPKLVPAGLQNGMEAVVDFIRNGIVMEVMGPTGLRYLPFLTALFFFIFVNNIFGILPFIQFPVNSRMAIPAFLAVLVWFIYNIAGIKAQGLGGYLKSSLFPPGVPGPIYILATPIEFISTFLLRPFTLAVRLAANMIAGHLILTIFFVGTWYLQWKLLTIPFAALSFALGTALVAFEILVAVLQAYIFTILTAVYIAGSEHPEH
jgi:F-type H+-transporting ATPase subunit a